MQTQTDVAPAAAPAPAPTSGRPDRASIVAEMAAAFSGTPAEPEAPPPPADPPPAPAEPKPDAVEEPEEDAEEDAVGDPPTTEPPLKVDAADAKRLEAIQRAEKRSKELLAKERESFESERKTWQTEQAAKLERIQRFEDLERRAAYDPAEVLLALGVPEDHLEPVARAVFLRSKKGAADPRAREAVQRSMRERELEDRLNQVSKKLEEREKREAEERQSAQVRRQVDAYLDAAASSAGDDTPLVKNLLANDPAYARHRLHEVAVELSVELDGETPEHADVARALEKSERALLAKRGIDFSSAAAAATPKNKTLAAGEKKRPVTLSNDLGTPRSPRSAPLSRQEQAEETLRALREGRLD